MLESSWRAQASEAELAANAATVDLDAEEFTCPACSSVFPRAPRCPECGLRLG